MRFSFAQYEKRLPQSEIAHHSKHEAGVWFCQSCCLISISSSRSVFISALRYVVPCSLSITYSSTHRKIQEEREVCQEIIPQKHLPFQTCIRLLL